MRRHAFLAVLVLASILVATPTGAQSPAFHAATADVATWNLAGFNRLPTAKAPVFAEAIAALDAEVVVLVEVNPDGYVENLVDELRELGLGYRATLVDQSARQNIAILAKLGVSVENPRLVEGSDNGNVHLRKALAADVRIGSFDFLLIGVHLKAGRDRSDREVRNAQVTAIESFIVEATAGDEKDVLLIGDYNMVPGDDQTNFDLLNTTGGLRYLSSELPEGTFSHISRSGSHRLLDGYAIATEHTREYLAGSLRVVPLHEISDLDLGAYRDRISDHLPLIADFRVYLDDD